MRAFRTVLLKEIRDNLRDRRALFVALLLPLLTPVMLGVMLVWNVSNQIESFEAPLTLPVKNLSGTSFLGRKLVENGCTLVDAGDDPVALVRTSTYPVVLIAVGEMQRDLRQGEPSHIELIVDSGSHDSQRAAARVRHVIESMGQQLAIVRSIARGIDPAILTPFVIAENDVATPEARMAFLFAGVPFTLVMLAFMGGLYVAIDTTAGERERNSFEALMLNPVSRAAVAFGKLGAVSFFAWLALATAAVGLIALPHVLPTRALDVPLRLDVPTVLAAIVLLIPLTTFAGALQTFVATRAKGFKEAQATLSYVVLVPIFPAMVQMLAQPTPRASLMWVPGLAEQIIIDRWLRAETIPLPLIALTVASTSAFAVAFTWLAVRRYNDERMFLP